MEKEKEENFGGLKKLRAAKEPWSVRLLPDDSELFCYTQVEFDIGVRYNFYPDKILYVALERPKKYKLKGVSTLYAVIANIKYLNNTLDKKELQNLGEYIVENHFLTVHHSDEILKVISWVMTMFNKGMLKPNGRYRRIIFNRGFPMTIKEKLSIVGKMTSRTSTITELNIYDCIEQMQCGDKLIKLSDIARLLGVSLSTVTRNITTILKDHIKDINNSIKEERDLKKLKYIFNHFKKKGIKYKIVDIRRASKFSGKRFKYLKKILDGQKSLI